ncbi:hypothetical protein IV203_034638 [Nitzschia inconspicua]|nr:hypothetical protein IV203_034638 [Nitzschia inconspicua]
MQAKIDDAKKRQAALREKFVSLHRVKKTASSPQTDRDFEALALSPAGRKRKGDVSRRRKPKDGSIRPSTRTSTNALTRAPPVYSKSEAALEQSVAHGEITPEQVPDSAIEQATLDRTCSTPVHGGKPVSASPLTTMEGSEASELPTPAKSTSTADSRFLTLDDVLQSPSTKDDTATKEMIMSLFNSWTSKQFTS